MAGVAGLPSDSNINGCDTETGLKNPSKALIGSPICRTSYRTSGYVYFIRAGDKIKIGFSSRPLDRLKNLQTSHPGQLEIIGTLRGTLDLERRLHKAFKRYRIRGEWFHGAPAIFRYIEGYTVEGIARRDQRNKDMQPMGPAPFVEKRDSATIGKLMAMRAKFGPASPKGIVCSTLLEQLENYRTATGMQRANLAKLIPASMARLA